MFKNIFSIFHFFLFNKKIKMKIIYQSFHFLPAAESLPFSFSIYNQETELLPFIAPADCCSHQKKATFNSMKRGFIWTTAFKILETISGKVKNISIVVAIRCLKDIRLFHG